MAIGVLVIQWDHLSIFLNWDHSQCRNSLRKRTNLEVVHKLVFGLRTPVYPRHWDLACIHRMISTFIRGCCFMHSQDRWWTVKSSDPAHERETESESESRERVCLIIHKWVNHWFDRVVILSIMYVIVTHHWLTGIDAVKDLTVDSSCGTLRSTIDTRQT